MQNRRPNRLKYYDYSKASWYFVTICTKDHKHLFGEITNAKMILNGIGVKLDEYLNSIPIHFPNTELDEYIIMPNHIHAIIIIDYNSVGNENFRSLHKTNLSNIIKGFKIGVTKWCRNNKIEHFKWQKSFYERIIRNEKEFFSIRKYIQQNPLKWDIEKGYENLDF